MRVRQPCQWCGRITTARHGVCAMCLHTELHRDVADPRDGLVGDHWRPRGGIQVWVGPRPVDRDYDRRSA